MARLLQITPLVLVMWAMFPQVCAQDVASDLAKKTISSNEAVVRKAFDELKSRSYRVRMNT